MICESCELRPATREVDLRSGDHSAEPFLVCDLCAPPAPLTLVPA